MFNALSRSIGESDVEALRSGAIDFGGFAKKHRAYFDKMARYFHQRASWAHLIVDVDDLVQVGMLAAWRAVQKYRFKCPACGRFAASAASLAKHGQARHGKARPASPTLLEWMHGQTGSAIDHTVTRDVRRDRFVFDPPTASQRRKSADRGMDESGGADWFEFKLVQNPTQEHAAEFSMLMDEAMRNLAPIQIDVLSAMIAGESPVEAVEAWGFTRSAAEREAKKIRTEINLEFIYPMVARDAR